VASAVYDGAKAFVGELKKTADTFTDPKHNAICEDEKKRKVHETLLFG